MTILISSSSLDRSGVPTYTLTLYKELERLGFDVMVYSPKLGPMAKEMKVYTNFDAMPMPGVILAQANKCATWVKGAFPHVPMIFISHGVIPDEEQPPRFPIDWYIAVNEEARINLMSQYINPLKITIIRDFIDTDLFVKLEPLEEKPRVLFVSNYKKWKTYYNIEAACEKLGLEFRAVGSPYGQCEDMPELYNEFDLVIGKGRCLLEAMSCGREVISYNDKLGDGYLDEKMYLESRERNFGGRLCRYSFSAEDVVEEIKKYNPNGDNRKRVLENHEVKKCSIQILDVIKEVLR